MSIFMPASLIPLAPKEEYKIHEAKSSELNDGLNDFLEQQTNLEDYEYWLNDVPLELPETVLLSLESYLNDLARWSKEALAAFELDFQQVAKQPLAIRLRNEQIVKIIGYNPQDSRFIFLNETGKEEQINLRAVVEIYVLSKIGD